MKNIVQLTQRVATSKSASSSILRNVLTMIAILGVNTCTGILVARSFGRIGRGEVTAMVLWPQLLAVVFSFGIPNGVVYYSRKNPDREGSYVLAAFALSAIASVAMIIFGYFVIPREMSQYDPTIIRAAQLIMLLSPFMLFGYSMSAFFQARSDFSYFNLLKYLSVIPTLFLLVLLALLGKLTPITAALCYFFPPIPIFFVSLSRLLRLTNMKIHDVRPTMNLLLRYGLRGAGLDLITGISSQVDQVFVLGFLSVSDMGIYAVALSVSRVLNAFFSATSNVILPKSVNLEPGDMTIFVGRALRLASSAALGAAIVLSAIIPFLLPRIYGAQFMRSVPISIALFGEYIFTGSTGILVAAFMARGRPGTVTLLEAGSLVLNLLFMLALVPRFGLLGAAASLILTAVLRFAAFYGSYTSIVGGKRPPLILDTGDIRYVLALVRKHQEAA